MSARDEILKFLWIAVPSSDNEEAKAKAAEMLDTYAHELAEKQRAERDKQYGRLEFKAEKIAINHVVDLIDPYVK